MKKLNNNLTEHEMNILKLLAKGYSHKEISAIIGTSSVSAVNKTLHILSRKFGVSGQVNILRSALINGMLHLRDLRREYHE